MARKKESEKVLERKLSRELKRRGGRALKLPATYQSGLPDRMCLLPGGRMFFVEVKTTGEKPRELQRVMHRRLRRMGFVVETIGTSEKLQKVLEEHATRE